MKILYYSKPYFGDCDFPLIKALREQGHDVTVIISMTPHSLKNNVFNIKKIYPHDGIFPITIYPELTSFSKFLSLDNIYIANDTKGHFNWQQIKQTIKLMAFFRNGKYDIINYVETPSIYTFLPLWFFRKKIVMTIHDGMPHTGEENKREGKIRKFIRHYIRKFIVLNKAEIEVFSKGYNIPRKKIYTSRLGFYDMLHMNNNIIFT